MIIWVAGPRGAETLGREHGEIAVLSLRVAGCGSGRGVGGHSDSALSGADVAFAALACGQTVTADTTLDRDLEGCAEDGLIIGAAGVTLDLNGHWITGSAVGSTGSGVLIAADDATVRNGRVAGFSVGVAADAQQGFGFDFRLDSLELVRNGIGVSAFDPGGLTGHFATIESSEISRNADRGISASFYNVTVTDSMIRRNGGDGIPRWKALVATRGTTSPTTEERGWFSMTMSRPWSATGYTETADPGSY